jgi:hypothetical protein
MLCQHYVWEVVLIVIIYGLLTCSLMYTVWLSTISCCHNEITVFNWKKRYELWIKYSATCAENGRMFIPIVWMTDMATSLFVWSLILLVVAPSPVHCDRHIAILCLQPMCLLPLCDQCDSPIWLPLFYVLPSLHAIYMYSFGLPPFLWNEMKVL